MKTWFRAVAVSTLAVAFAFGSAAAADETKGKTGGGTTDYKSSGSGASGTSDPSSSGSGAGASPSTSDFQGRHTMTGEVTKIDPKKGTFRLRTAEGTLDLHAPPSALQNVKKGDRLTVEIAIKPNGSAAASGSPSTGSSPSGSSGPKK